MRVGIGFDSHRFVEGRPLVLGGVRVPHTHGLDGHSDADVLTHAIVDALLGAAALGDIGTHFPDRDLEWKDADSRQFLVTALAKVKDAGYRPVNVDATVIAEVPKLAPVIGDIRAALSATMGLDVGAVSVKATTAEAMGALGRREGMAALAVVSVEPVSSGRR